MRSNNMASSKSMGGINNQSEALGFLSMEVQCHIRCIQQIFQCLSFFRQSKIFRCSYHLHHLHPKENGIQLSCIDRRHNDRRPIQPSVVQAYTQPYSLGGRIKLIICQIRHELSVTFHEIEVEKKCQMADNIYYLIQYAIICFKSSNIRNKSSWAFIEILKKIVTKKKYRN